MVSTMIFRNNLYIITCLHQEEHLARFELELNPQHEIFKAHFPGQPITPGVCLLQIARELVEELTSLSLEVHQVKNVKFLSIVSPVETRQIIYLFDRLVLNENGTECRVQVTSLDNRQLAKMSFKCKKCAE